MNGKPYDLSKIFKALGDENRLHILDLLEGAERCACMLLDEMHISQPTLSHHMKILCDANLIVGRKEGKWMHYRLNTEQFQQLADFFQKTAETNKTEFFFIEEK